MVVKAIFPFVPAQEVGEVTAPATKVGIGLTFTSAEPLMEVPVQLASLTLVTVYVPAAAPTMVYGLLEMPVLEVDVVPFE